MEREAKRKVVASVSGSNCVQFLAAQAVLSPSIWKKRLNSFLSFKPTKAKKQLARQGTEQMFPPLFQDLFFSRPSLFSFLNHLFIFCRLCDLKLFSPTSSHYDPHVLSHNDILGKCVYTHHTFYTTPHPDICIVIVTCSLVVQLNVVHCCSVP